jgi:hypothetical protein
MSSAKRQLPPSIASPQDLTALILELREYARWSSRVAVKKQLRLKHSSDPPAISRTAKELLQSWLAKRTVSEKSLDELIAALEDFKTKAPSLTITLATMPPNSLRQTIVAWCRDNIAADVLVTFQFNNAVLGGLGVRYGSHMFDWSFRRIILENRGKFPEVLRRV